MRAELDATIKDAVVELDEGKVDKVALSHLLSDISTRLLEGSSPPVPKKASNG